MILPGVTASGRQVAPSVRTDAATNVVASGGVLTQAVLNGTVLRAENSSNSVVFHWGTSSTLATFTTTSAVVVAQGSVNQAVSAAITSLAQGTTYYYRVVSTNTADTTNGSIVSFTTPFNVASVTTGAGSDGTATPTASTSAPSNYAKTTATVGGTFGSASSAYMMYSSMSNFASPTTTPSRTTSPLSEGISGLSGNTTYYTKIIAVNTNRVLNMAGTVNPNGSSTTVTFRYSTNAAFTTNVGTVGGGTFSGTTTQNATASVSGLAEGTWYFRIEATNSGGSSIGGTSSGVAVSSKVTEGSVTQFTTYTDRSQTYSTVTENGIWSYPSIPSGGAPVTSIFVVCIGAGGGGGRTTNGKGAGGGGGGGYAAGTLSVSNNSATIVVGRGGVGAGKVSPYSNNGQGSSVSIGGQSITAGGGTVGDSEGAANGGSSTYSGGSGYVVDPYIFTGGGGGGGNGRGGDGGSTVAGVGGFGVGGQRGGGGGAGVYYTYVYPFGFSANPVAASGTDGGGNGNASGNGGDATNYGGGGGASYGGVGGNGYQGLVTVSWVGP